MRHAARALRALLTLSQAQHKRWIAEAGVDHLLKTDGGWLKLFRTEKGFANYQAEMDLMRSVGLISPSTKLQKFVRWNRP